jgi:hypothetical protein
MADLSGIAGGIYQFRIWLRGISPMIWRRMLVPATTHLAAFHTITQQAFGWDDCHPGAGLILALDEVDPRPLAR